MVLGFYMQPQTAFNCDNILSSSPTYPGTGNGAFQFAFGSGSCNQVVVKINTITGGLITVGTCAAQTLNTTYMILVAWNGTTYYSWQGTPGGTAVSCGTATSSNRPIQGQTEEIMLPGGGHSEFWPDSGNADSAFVGDMSSLYFEAENISTYNAPFTVPTGGFTSDGFTALLCNFQTSLDGTQICTTQLGGGNTTGLPLGLKNVYFPIIGSSGIGLASGIHIHDMEECAGQNPGNGYVPDGWYIAGANSGREENVDCANNWFVAHDFAAEDYDFVANNVTAAGGLVNKVWDANPAGSVDVAGKASNERIACDIWNGGGGGDHNVFYPTCSDQGASTYAWIENQSSGTYYYPFVDSEFTNTSWVTNFLLNSPNAPYTFISGNIATKNSAPWFQQDNGGSGSIVIGTTLSDFAASADPAESILFTGGTPPSTQWQMSNPLVGNTFSTPATSNLPEWVQTNGVSFVTFAQMNAITCNAALDGQSLGLMVKDATTCTTGSLIVASGGGTTYCTAVCHNGTGWVH
jgi:hypothetical protein